ncbi:bacteriocin-like protein [Chryseobacterium sp. FH2]
MKNLRKLTRKEQQQINGGTISKRCQTNNDCLGLWCCDMRCVNIACVQF